jgi:PelA/Pel-15E family pectate lyase
MTDRTPFLCVRLAVIIAAQLVAAGPAWSGEPRPGKEFRYRPPEEPARLGRRVLFYASYDDGARPLDATFCYGDGTAGGDKFVSTAEGRFGGGVQAADTAANLFYRAAHNIRADAGTISMWVATGDGKPLSNGQDRWLFGWRGPRIAGAFIRGEDGALVFGFGKRAIVAETCYALALDPLSEGWHHVTVSWDGARNRLWMGCDGKGVSYDFDATQVRQPDALFVGSAPDGQGAAAPVAIAIDDFAVYDAPLDRLAEPRWPAGFDSRLVWQAEAAARRFLRALAQQQQGGGWAVIYTWPNLLPCGAQGRDTISPASFISNDKRCSTAATAAQFLYAWEIFGDPAYLEAARAAGDLYVTAWEREGAWAHSYTVTPAGPQGIGGRTVKLQDGNQAHPIFLLTYLHRLTKDDRYRKTALAGGELVLSAQNTNGSWSYGYDVERKIGVTAFGIPHGGEINDRCMNDGMDVMLLMYHLTGDERFLAALTRAGEWLLKVQSTGATAGWAEQYGADDQPIWARPFEPPAIAPGRSVDAADAVRLMWQLTGDDRYRRSILRFAAWLETTATDAGWWEYYDPESGRPLLAADRRQYFADDEQEMAAYMRQMPAGEPIPKPERRANPARIRRWVDDSVSAGRETPIAGNLELLFASATDAVTRTVAEQDASGFWIHPSYPVGGYGPQVFAREQKLVELLQFVERARMIVGELPLEFRGDCDLNKAAFPSDRWLTTPLRGPQTHEPDTN